ncbi:MAG: hypothetical protein AB199_01730 [Parcubacteria bacterium C7867-004]|nr:MAG: hypothetical protein AB199_01730 [Parcubacteria bacterium C7867-004]
MSDKFCIKKNATASLNPWLCRIAPKMGMGDGLVYAPLLDIVMGLCVLETFTSIEKAQEFIAANPESCTDQCLVYAVRSTMGEVDMVPV